MNDTTRRFLNSVLERVSETRIVELRLFPAIRQGGIESGIAVLAVEPEPELPPVVEGAFTEPTDDIAVLDAEVTAAADAADIEIAIEHPADMAEEATTELEVDEEALQLVSETHVASDSTGEIVVVDDASDREATLEVSTEGVGDVEVPLVASDVETEVELEATIVADEASADDAAETVALGDILALPSPEGAVVEESSGPKRLAILCARYKLVFKGPDRGKWDLEIMHQADAPLDTLDRVISGVVRRSGEESEPERFSRESLRASLDAPVWAQSA